MLKTFMPIDFLAVARDLANRSQDEATLRAAIGRAYYAVFLTARDKAHIQGTDGLHVRVKNAIKTRDYIAAAAFKSLGDLRVEADYVTVTRDPTYQDWLANWRLADHYATELVEFLKTW
jgi:hypothetical protein